MISFTLSHVRRRVGGWLASAFQKLLIRSVLRVAMRSSSTARTSPLDSAYSISFTLAIPFYVGGPEMAPHAPHAPRPGGAVALRECTSGRGGCARRPGKSRRGSSITPLPPRLQCGPTGGGADHAEGDADRGAEYRAGGRGRVPGLVRHRAPARAAARARLPRVRALDRGRRAARLAGHVRSRVRRRPEEPRLSGHRRREPLALV